MAEKQMTLEDITREVAKELGIDKLFESPEGRAAMTAIVNSAMAELETRMKSEIAEERKLRTAAEEGLAELSAKFERRASFDRDFGIHRGLDGRLQPNVQRSTAEALTRLLGAFARKDFDAARAVSTGVNSEGGYLLQTDVAEDVLRLIPEMGLYPSLARPFPMGNKKVDIGSVLSQMGAYWPDENSAITESFPSFGKVPLEAKTCGALIPVPMNLLEDSTPETGQLFADLIRECIMKEIDRVGIAGKASDNGGTDPFNGLLYAASINAKVLESGKTHISDISPDDLLSLQTTAPEGARDNGSYLLSSTLFEAIRKVKTSTGEYINAHYITAPTGNEGWKIWGRPAYMTDRLPAYSTAVQASKRTVVYGDFKRWAVFGTRKELAIASSDVAGDAFKNVQMLIRGLTRVGIAAFGPALAELETAAS